MARPNPVVNRVRIANYKSIGSCDVTLGPLTILVGPNGAGKSNFLDALSFVSDAVRTTPAEALDKRNGVREVLRRGSDGATSFQIRLDVVVPWGPDPDQLAHGEYGFEIAAIDLRGRRPYEVVWEECVLSWQDVTSRFRVDRGEVDDPVTRIPEQRIQSDRLYLPTASTRTNFAPIYGALLRMLSYRLDPVTLRQPQQERSEPSLGPLGERLGEVLGALGTEQPAEKERIDEYLSAIVPGTVGIDREFAGSSYVTVMMRQRTSDGTIMEFGSDAISDGTIRAAGVLAALFQPSARNGWASMIAIEEPEIALHPAATGVLFDALSEASTQVQVLATSQSADLLDRDDIDPQLIRAVKTEDGRTFIDELDQASRIIVGEKLYTLGELMRGNQLSPHRAG